MTIQIIHCMLYLISMYITHQLKTDKVQYIPNILWSYLISKYKIILHVIGI